MLWRKDSAVRPRFLVGSPGALAEVTARTEEGRKKGRMAGEEGRISKDGRRLITPRDICSFASVERKGIAGSEGKRSAMENALRGSVCVNLARTCARSRRNDHARVVTQSIYAMPVIHRYRLAVATFVLLHEVYRITLPLHPPFTRPPSFSHPFSLVPTMRQRGRETRERDKLTDDWYLMKICLPMGRKIRDESGMNWLRDI